MKRTLAALLAVGALGLTALPATGAAAGSSSKSIVQIAAASPQFSTLVKLVKSAGLVSALSGKTKLTLFAPTNAAFQKIPKAKLNKLAHNKGLLRSVLLYHVAQGRLLANQIEKRSSIKSLEGATIKIHVRKGSVYVNGTRVIKANVLASNGVIHVINGVLTPPS